MLCFTIIALVFNHYYKISYTKIPWSIGLYESDIEFKLNEIDHNPVLTKNDCRKFGSVFFVADPFVYHENNEYLMFYEVGLEDKTDRRGVIGLAKSVDGLHWLPDKIILEDKVSISFPIVFKYDNSYYMTIEGRLANNIRLFKANNFPYDWNCVDTLLTGAWSDPVIHIVDGKFYLFVSKALKYDAYLFCSTSLTGKYTPHSQNPLTTDKRIGRNAGNIFTINGKRFRPVQDCSRMYGEKVRLMEINELTDSTYKETEVNVSPILMGNGNGWNKTKMHTFNVFNFRDNKFMIATDGAPYHTPQKLHIYKRR